MDGLTFFAQMGRGRYNAEKGIEGSSYCIFYAPVEVPVVQDKISGDEERMTLNLRYGIGDTAGGIRIRQVGSNVILEETAEGRFKDWLADRQIKYIGHLLMFALQFRIEDLSVMVDDSEEELKNLEDTLDNSIDNSGTYLLLDFRRRFAELGTGIIAIKEIITRINKGYYSEQIQNSYVQLGRVETDFQFLDEKYELLRETVLKDFDTYTSIVNNNINRNVRLLSIISIFAVVLNFMFGSFLIAHPVIGILSGLAVAAVSTSAIGMWHINRRNPMLNDPSAEFFRAYIAEESKPKSSKKLIAAKKNSHK